MKTNKILLTIFVIVTFSVVINAQAAFDPEVEDVAALPGLLAAAIAGLLIGGKKLLRK
ncbi:hypothetical protein LY01_02559 [Nonlabens xylanidelens]|uniref:Uncharacterized protein n=1 Tax=Nonlabens xylanidelens TaxID=191564 RepID=A0A2S6IGC7_9FLAO|nr:hypothetical protein [Nonlabens xylanidelens]PPK93274.1 hypothetical protein LY01_02559 [Nonlabens xylanidelens]